MSLTLKQMLWSPKLKRCPNTTHRNKKTKMCEPFKRTKKRRRITFHSFSLPSSRKSTEKKRKLRASDRNKYIKLIDKYNEMHKNFVDETEIYSGYIYDFLRKIAKRKYSKDPEFAEFQEQFFKRFLRDDEFISGEYDKKKHNYLIRLRKQVDKKNKNNKI
jgi:hypothetical protein